jgi:hypothetical protein
VASEQADHEHAEHGNDQALEDDECEHAVLVLLRARSSCGRR